MQLQIKDLVGRGYFPQELPPPFTTTSLASFVSRCAGESLPFRTTGIAKKSKPELYSLARSGTLRRELSILNPIHFCILAKFVVDNWQKLHDIATGSSFSLTKPKLTRTRRAISRLHDLDYVPLARAHQRGRGRYLLLGDIAQFYSNVYTHSIPWAIHGKAVAKADQSSALWGNRLDTLIRNCQDNQTSGIPIGPDTSLLIAEILLAKVDIELSRKRLNGIRYIDDYEVVLHSEEAAIRAQTLLESELLKFELRLNPNKTRIISLPQQIEDPWIAELRRMKLMGYPFDDRDSIIQFFDKAFDLAKLYPTSNVLKYAAGRVSKFSLSSRHADLIEDLQIQCARVEAGALPFVMKSILRSKSSRKAREKTRRELFHNLIIEHASKRHSSEVAWSIWACIALRIKLQSKAVELILQMEDSVCALLLLHAKSEGLVTSKINLNPLKSAIKAEELYDRRWLLAYEANIQNWLPLNPSEDYVSTDVNFGKLKSDNVSFYDKALTTLPELDDEKGVASMVSRLPKDYSENSEDAEENEEDEDEAEATTDPFGFDEE